jgi:mono/diheme cytochrome c family protein
MVRLVKVVVAILAVIGVCALVGGEMFMAGGISARQAPGSFESSMAPRLRSMGIPRAAREMKSPVPPSGDAVKEGMEHFADHCALCHANDGSGNTHMGQNLYPRVPDMRQAATQSLTDGELYYIIDNGVKMSGMPGWGGDPEHGPEANWNLVQFIRHLPKLTPAEEAQMRDLNPKAPDDMPGHKGGEDHDHADHKHGGD